MQIAVVGLGKIGLPLAAQFADKGHQVTGVDIQTKTVSTINAGQEPFSGESGLGARLARLVPAGILRATTNYAEAIPEAEAVVVVVPLFVDGAGKPEFSSIDSATEKIAENLSPDTLVIYETTLPVGTTRNRWKPRLEQGSGLTEGIDFHVVFSPERVLTGRVFEDLRKYPKLVGGLRPAGARAARAFYEQVLDFDHRRDLERGNGVWDLGSAEAAELAKLAETTYRDVNIGLANQFAVYADRIGIDVFAVIEASNSQPYSHIHSPGIAVGGHCIPVYPLLYMATDPHATVVHAARQANKAMPAHAIDLLEGAYGAIENAKVVVLGVSYRTGVKESAFSGVFSTVRQLEDRGAIVLAHDPLFSDPELRALGLEPFHLGEGADAGVIQTAHAQYQTMVADDIPGIKVLVDGRNLTDDVHWEGVTRIVLGNARRTSTCE